MARFILSPAAEYDISSILAWSHEHFGERARLRYEAFIVQAMVDAAENPRRPGSAARDEISAGVRTYHLWHSRDGVERVRGGAARPRHFLLYRAAGKNRVEIGRVLHDSMDLPSHLPDEYRATADESGGESEG